VVGFSHHRFFSSLQGATLEEGKRHLERRQGASDKKFLNLNFRFHCETLNLTEIMDIGKKFKIRYLLPQPALMRACSLGFSIEPLLPGNTEPWLKHRYPLDRESFGGLLYSEAENLSGFL